MRLSYLSVVICAGSITFGGCGTARIVKQDQVGGILALKGDQGKAHEQAQQIMTQHCQGPYHIVEQGETVIGSRTHGGEETYATRRGTVVTRGGSSTRDVTEWRITYRCGLQPQRPGTITPVAPAGTPPPPPPASTSTSTSTSTR